MVNFKYWILPLAVGLLSSKVKAQCSFSKDTSGNVVVASGATCSDDYYLVDTTATPSPTIITATGTPGSLIQIASSTVTVIATPTPGYYSSTNLIECFARGGCKKAITDTVSSCTSDDIGKYTTDGIVIGCNGSSKVAIKFDGTGYEFSSDKKIYLSAFAKDHAFGFDPSVNYYGIYLETNKYIVFNNTINIDDDVGVKLSTGEVLFDRKEAFCGGATNYYTCKKGKCVGRGVTDYSVPEPNTGICTITDGPSSPYTITNCIANSGYYIVNTDKLCKIKEVAGKCAEVSNPTRGYYWNSYYYNRIIHCNGTTCKEVPAVVSDSCNSNLVGQIIDDGYNVYFCKTSSDKVLLETFAKEVAAATTELKFKVAGDNKGGIFDNVDAYYAITTLDNEDSTTPKVTALIVDTSYNGIINNAECVDGVCLINKCTFTVSTDASKKSTCAASHCASTEFEGFSFVDKNGNIVYNENSAGFLVKYTLAGNKCDVVSQIKEGAYLNQVDKVIPGGTTKLNEKFPLVVCTSSECKLEKNPSTSFKYYNVGDATKPIISCDANGCTAAAATKDYYNNGNRKLIACSIGQDGTVGCVVKGKEAVSPNKYYPVKAFADEETVVDGVIKCSSDDCEDVEFSPQSTDPADISIFINGFDEKSIIKCTNDVCKKMAGNDVSTGFTKYYKDSKETVDLIKCPSGEKCQAAQGSNGYGYITDGTTEIIVCEDNVCKSKAFVGGKYMNGGDGKTIIDCKSGTGCQSEDGVPNKLSINHGKKGSLILCKKANECIEFAASAGKSYISYLDNKIYSFSGNWDEVQWQSNDIVGYLYNPVNFEVLTDNSVSGKLILCGKLTTNAQSITCTTQNSNIKNYYINGAYSAGGFKLIENNNSVLSLIKPTNGYYMNDNTSEIIKCTGETTCDSYVTSDADRDFAIPTTGDVKGKCIANSAGQIVKGNLCYASNESPITLSDATKTTRYLISGMSSNNVLGLSSNSNYMFNVNNKKITLVTVSGDEYYLFGSNNKLVTTKDAKGTVYKCTSSGNSCSSEGAVNAGDIKVYPNSDVETAATYPRIKCTNESEAKCVSEGPSNDDFYCAIESNLYQCKQSGSFTTCPSTVVDAKANKCSPVSHGTGYYLSVVDNTSLIHCTAANVCKKTDDATAPEALHEGYYKSEDPAKQLIKCVRTFGKIRCLYAEEVKNGYYIIGDTSVADKLIKCESKACKEETITPGWYVSGDNALIECNGSDPCETNLIPKEGWYVNGDGIKSNHPDGKYLIKCNNQYRCEVSGVNNEGKYISAAGNGKLIDCSSSSCVEAVASVGNVYYINGENKQLIYCVSFVPGITQCESVTPGNSFTTWYITSDPKQLIGCNKNKECKLYDTPSKSGYYLNGDSNSITYPLIYYDESSGKFVLSNDYLACGWYRNGSGEADNTEKMIRCNSASSCLYVEAQKKDCSGIAGGFSVVNGALEWCNMDGLAVGLEGDGKKRAVLLKRADNIPGMPLIEGIKEQYALIEISKDKIVSVKGYDGYFYNEGLFECPRRNKGICTKVEVIANGYYFGSEGIYACSGGKCEVNKDIDSACGSSNSVVIDGFKLCKDDTNTNGVDISGIDNESLYALKVEGKGFPGSETDKYILANVNKYAVKFAEKIGMKCTTALGVTSTVVCDANSNGKQINSKCGEKTSGTYYDYETNEGYFICGANTLSKVIIPRVDKDNNKYKIECKIGGACSDKKLAVEPYKWYRLRDDGVLIGILLSGKEEVVPEIKEGVYLAANGTVIKCNVEGVCVVKEVLSSTEKANEISRDVSGNLVFGEGGNKITSSIEGSKYILKQGVNPTLTRRSLMKRDGSSTTTYDTVLELTHVSYTSSSETRNIFVDSEYFMISTDTNLDTVVEAGFICVNEICRNVDKSGNKKYYINTVQLGQNVNAYVECGGGSCEMKSLSLDNNNVLVPNGAAKGVSDALISCKFGKGCEVVGAVSGAGLPNCKVNANKSIYMENGNGSFRKENDEALLIGQYCLFNGVPIENKETHNEATDIVSEGVSVFNVALQKVNIGQIAEDYINASMYYCVRNGAGKLQCSRTYGYLTEGSGSGYSVCTKSGCEYRKVANGKCEIDGAGAMVDIDNMCLSSVEEDTTKGKAPNRFYGVTVSKDKGFPEAGISSQIIVGVDGTSNIYALNEDGYVLIDNSSGIIEIAVAEVNSKYVLYKCTSENMNCVKVEKPEYGYYRNVFSSYAIKCNQNGCGTESTTVNFSKGGVVTYKEENENELPGYGYAVISETSADKIVALKVDNYVLLKEGKMAGNNERSTELYYCNSYTGKCEKEEEMMDAWYVSYKNGFGIYCEYKSSCYTKELAKSCSIGAGDLIYDTGNYYICSEKTKKSTKSVSELIGEVVNLTASPVVFPGKKDYISYGKGKVLGIARSSDQGKSGVMYEKLEKCNNQAIKNLGKGCFITSQNDLGGVADEKYCKRDDNNVLKIYYQKKQEDPSTSIDCVEYQGILILYGNKKVSSTEITQEKVYGAQMYYCGKEGCRLTTGYWGDIKCDSTGCVKVGVAGNKNGELKSSKLLVNGSSGGVDGGVGKYYYIYGNNVFPGAEGKKSILVESGVGADNEVYFIIFKGEGYYLVGSNELLKVDNASGSSNKLFLCGESDLVCEEVESPDTGYYLNAAVEAGKANAIIRCSKGDNGSSSCMIGKSPTEENKADVTGDVIDPEGALVCNENNIGRLLRDSKKATYKLCVGKQQSQDFSNKYVFMNLPHGNKFVDIKLESVGEQFAADSANILLKATSRSITQVRIDGYMLFSSNSVVENVSTNAKGTLYSCGNRAYESKDDSEKTYQCKDIKNAKNGLYFSTEYFGDRRYIKCSETGCTVSEAPESAVCENSGSLVYNNGKFELCQTKDKQIAVEGVNGEEVMMNVSKSNEFPGVKADNTNIMVKLNKSEITLIKKQSNVVVDEGNGNRILSVKANGEASDKGALYTCESSGSCSKIQYTKDNWYLYNDDTTTANQLIYCYKRECSIHNPVEGFYISSNVDMPIIQCIQPGTLNENNEVVNEAGLKDKIICKERKFVEGWYVNAEGSGLIECTAENGCIRRSDILNGWYVNAGASYGYDKLTNIPIYPIIKCTLVSEVECGLYKEGEIGSSCTKGGEVIISGGNYKLCKNENAKDVVDFNKGGIEIIEVAGGDDFPSASSGKNIVKVSKDQANPVKKEGYYLKDKVMYKCDKAVCEVISDNGSNEMVVLEELSKTLYVGACADDSCSWTQYKDEGYYFINDGDKDVLFTYENNNNSIANINLEVYYCRKSDSRSALTCKNVSDSIGYMYNSHHSVEGKVVNTLYHKSEEGYSVADADHLRKCSLYKAGSCYISYDNEPYKEEGDIYDGGTNLPKDIEKGSVCVTSNGKLYFALDTIDTGIGKENCVAVPGTSDNSSRYYKISENEMYLVDKYGVRKANPEGVYSESNCTYDIKNGGVCKSSGSVVVNAGEGCRSTLNPENLYLALVKVGSTGGKCVGYVKDNQDRLEDDIGAVIDRDDDVDGKQLYLVGGSVYSVSKREVKVLEEGVYTVDGTNYNVTLAENYNMSLGEGSKYKMYVCNGEGCKTKTQCENGSEFEYIFDGIRGNVVKCDPETNTVSRIRTAGYYLNAPWKDLIKCYSDGKCVEIDSEKGMEGYYMNAGNKDKMIVCKRNGDEFSCSEESIISCTYDESEGKCSGKVDLLRNSYCLYRKDDKVGKVEKLLYVENFVKKGSSGKCILGGGEDVFVHHRASKFLGHEERHDLIRVNKESIVSIYEKDIGYYLIDTKNGKGLISDKAMKKTRFYVCRKQGCQEEAPENNAMYINKASKKKLVKYVGWVQNGWIVSPIDTWYVIDNGCVIDKKNTKMCNFDNESVINLNSIIYKDQYDEVTLYDSRTDITKRTKLEEVHDELKKETFVKFNGLFLFEGSGQMFSKQNEDGLYMFNEPGSSYEYSFNLVPYNNTRNETEIKFIAYDNDGTLLNVEELEKEGYFVNKADFEGKGIVIARMNIPEKLEPAKPAEGEEETPADEKVPDIHEKYKAVINKCTSEKKNVCKSVEADAVINDGSVCVVTEGEYKGLYLAINTINTNSQTYNCVKYEEGLTYRYIGKKTQFAGMDFSNILIRVDKNSIVPFRHNFEEEGGYDEGYYVLEETEEKNLVKFPTDANKTASAYYCRKDVDYDENERPIDVGYSCVAVSSINNMESKYYYTYPGGDVMEYKGKKWRNETATGYYFFNKEYKPASYVVDEEGEPEYDNVVYGYSVALGELKIYESGKYLNSAEKSKVVAVKYDKDDTNEASKVKMYEGLTMCTIKKDGTCDNEKGDLDVDDICYSKNDKEIKLYVANVIESEVEEVPSTKLCYTGSVDRIKYTLIGSTLYMLDGMSVKIVEDGYYILDENWEAFNSKYPVVPAVIVKCTGVESCSVVKEKLELNQDVIINSAIGEVGGSKTLLRYYEGEYGHEKMMNIKKEGFYCLDEEGVIDLGEKDEDSADYCWTMTEEGLKTGLIGCAADDICINSAVSSGNIVINNGLIKKMNSKVIKVNYEKDYILFNNEYNLDNGKDVFKFNGEKLYKLKKEKLEHVKAGLYLLENERAFVGTEPKQLSGKDACFYSGVKCEKELLNSYRDHKYVINRAADTIVTYDSKEEVWSTVDKDGYYFFFAIGKEQPYSIDLEDRRIYVNDPEVRVRRIVDGEVVKEEKFNNGVYLTEFRNAKLNDESIVVERVGDEWYDAQYVFENVEAASRRRCKAIETDGKIEPEAYCYSEKYGICTAKSTITDKTENESNCVFSDDSQSYYYIVNGSLYLVNGNTLQVVKRDGLYVIDDENVAYSNSKENDANAILCVEGSCGVVRELKSMYYLNIASLELGEPVILYYNENRNSWKRVSEDGHYFFNKNGYGVLAEEEVKYHFVVSKNGNEIEGKEVMSIGESTKILSKSNSEESVYVSKEEESVVAKPLYECSIDSDGNVSTEGELAVGDLCQSDGNLVVISSVGSGSSKRQEDVGGSTSKSYKGVEASSEGKKYVLAEDKILIVDGESVEALNANGMVIIDDKTKLPLVSEIATEATAYKCESEKCVLIEVSSLTEGKNYLNSVSAEYPLVRYAGSGRWRVENEVGYYFFDEKVNAVGVDVNVDIIYEVRNSNEGLKQIQITEDSYVGYFMNKAFNGKDIVSNNNKYWSAGQKLNECSAAVKEEIGLVCKINGNTVEKYEMGEYCYDNKKKQLYFVIDTVTNSSEVNDENCVFGSNDNPKYVFYEGKGKKLNSVELTNVLIQVDGESIREADNGYYIVDENGYLIEDVESLGEEETPTIYFCDENGCSEEDVDEGSMIQTNTGELYTRNEEGVLQKVVKNGLYFFDGNGRICGEGNDVVGSIVRISGDGAVKEKVELDSLEEGAYINEGNVNYVGVYEEGQWSIEYVECQYEEAEGTCKNGSLVLGVGSYCSVEGKVHVITADDGLGGMKCIAGSETSPIFFKTEANKLMVVKEKSVSNVNEEGYYAINQATFEALVSEKPVKSQFVQCEYGGACKEVTPEIGRYVNRSPEEVNVVKFESAGVEEAVTLDSKCSVDESDANAVCSAINGTLEVGDVCINEKSIYIISSAVGDCLKAEKTIVTYQMINNKMYMLTDDAVIQKSDGYYFINGENRAITKKSDYAKADTVGYICSNKGECYLLQPTKVSYFPDYTNKSSKKYNVIKFDPERKSARRRRDDEESAGGNSGYEAISEEGIYKLDDGSYTECEMNDNDEIACHDIENEGSYMTKDGELVKCIENEEGEVECSQAVEGGYYVVDGELVECEANEEGDGLECKEVEKEGYFLAKPEDILYECSEKGEDEQAEVPTEDIEISKLLDELDGNGDGIDTNDEEDTETSSETATETTTTSTVEETTSTTTYEEYTPTPVAVVCKPVSCEVTKTVYQKTADGEDDLESPMYVCVENKFTTDKCDSGNYIKGRNGFYICESDKEDVDEEKIEKPNTEHTLKDESPAESTTTSSTTTTTTTQQESTTKSPEPTSAPPPTSTKSSTQGGSKATTTTKPSETAGASSLFRKLPSITFYLVIFIISFYILF